MFEFEQYDRRLDTEPEAAPALPYEPARNIASLSLLVWGEHCIECAAPACFQTCDLYQKRPDGLCRRFKFGVRRNRRFASMRGYGAEIAFKKWAKLEARANTTMQPAGTLLRRERAFEKAAPIFKQAGQLLRSGRLQRFHRSLAERWVERLRIRPGGDSQPDGFLLEIYNPTDRTIRLQMSMTLDPSVRHAQTSQVQPRPMLETLDLPPGYSRREFERRMFQQLIDSGLPFNIALIPEADTSARLVILTADFVTYQPAAKTASSQIKCVIFDLDNTLWDGTLLENPEVTPKPEIEKLITRLDERGILVSIASKNDFDHAWARLEQTGFSSYFLAPQINWMPKSSNIKLIAERLNLGLDAFAFVDDNPFELAEVSSVLPQVTCIDAAETGGLLDDPRFRGSTSEEARNRRRYYQDAIRREQDQTAYGDDYRGFLADCRIELVVRPYKSEDFERASELVQRTNQLNFSGAKYTREQLASLLEKDDVAKYLLECADKYGSYGIVGFSMVEHREDEIRILDFMLSCRVQGRFIEQAFFDHLQEHRQPGRGQATRLRVSFKPTQRNKPAQQVLEALHFEPCDTGEGLCLDLSKHSLAGHVIKVTFPDNPGKELGESEADVMAPIRNER